MNANRRAEFEVMVRAEYERVYRLAHHLTRDEHRAVDLTQETFHAAWENWPKFERRSQTSTWLHQIAYRKYIDEQRSRSVRDRAEKSTKQARTEACLSHDIIIQVQHDMHDAIQQLDEPERVVIVMRYLQGMSISETSVVTGEPSGTVKWRARSALMKLRRILKAETYP